MQNSIQDIIYSFEQNSLNSAETFCSSGAHRFFLSLKIFSIKFGNRGFCILYLQSHLRPRAALPFHQFFLENYIRSI